jgi:hypothetical protein
MAITKRCIRCRKPTRPDGTCQNPDCVRYVPEGQEPGKTNEKPAGGK